MDVKTERPTGASVTNPAPGAGDDRSAADHGDGGADDSSSDASTVSASRRLLMHRVGARMAI